MATDGRTSGREGDNGEGEEEGPKGQLQVAVRQSVGGSRALGQQERYAGGPRGELSMDRTTPIIFSLV